MGITKTPLQQAESLLAIIDKDAAEFDIDLTQKEKIEMAIRAATNAKDHWDKTTQELQTMLHNITT